MTSTLPTNDLVRSQFGAVADAYATSSYHATGADLAALVAAADVHGTERLLDLGCGAGDFTAALAAAGASPVGVDVAEAALRRARERHPGLDFRVVPLDGPLPLEDCEFGLVWASEVIEHVADTARWLSEVRRVLAPGGRLRFASDWADYVDWTLARFAAQPAFRWTAERADDWRTPPADHLTTRYEEKRLGDCAPVFLDFTRA